MAELHHTFKTFDGLQLFLRELPAIGEIVGPPVLCLHGLTRNSRDFEDILPRIAAGGRRALALDFRGRGRSDYDPNPMNYDYPIYARDVIGLLSDLGLAQVAIIGTSMGGATAMTIAETRADLLERVVLNDVGAAVSNAGLQKISAYVGRVVPFASYQAAAQIAMAVFGHNFPDQDLAFWEKALRRSMRDLPSGEVQADYDPNIRDVYVAIMEGLNGKDQEFWAGFKNMSATPVLVIHGALSDILTPDIIAAMRAQKPDLQVAEVPRVGHAPYLDEPEAWAAIAGFLGLRKSGGGQI